MWIDGRFSPFSQPQPTSNEVESAIRAVRRYNEDLMKGQAETGGEEKAPPIPLKKKTGKWGLGSLSPSSPSLFSPSSLCPSFSTSLSSSPICFPPLYLSHVSSYDPLLPSLPLPLFMLPNSLFPHTLTLHLSLLHCSHVVQGDSEGVPFRRHADAASLHPHGRDWATCPASKEEKKSKTGLHL